MFGGLGVVGVDLAEVVAVDAGLRFLQHNAQRGDEGFLHLGRGEFRTEC